MTSSLTLPSGSTIDSFQRRKNYNPSKAVENERLKKQSLNGKMNMPDKKSISKNSIESNEDDYSNNHSNNFNTTNSYGDEDSTSDSSVSFSLPVQSLTANINNKKVRNFI